VISPGVRKSPGERGSVNRQVYSWLDPARVRSLPDLDGLYKPSAMETIRAWGDAIIELAVERKGITCYPPLSIRRTALFAWTTAPDPNYREIAGKVPVSLTVDPGQCAVARMDLIHDVFNADSWRYLRDWLQDQGHAPHHVYEWIAPVSDPTGHVYLSAGREAVESLPSGMLADLLRYFENAAVRYAGTWRTLEEHSGGEGVWEVVVPRAGLHELVLRP
jgi:hypothetical protein